MRVKGARFTFYPVGSYRGHNLVATNDKKYPLLLKVLAHPSVTIDGWGDHYQLVSCLAYYLKRRALKVSWIAVCRTARMVMIEGREIGLYSITPYC